MKMDKSELLINHYVRMGYYWMCKTPADIAMAKRVAEANEVLAQWLKKWDGMRVLSNAPPAGISG